MNFKVIFAKNYPSINRNNFNKQKNKTLITIFIFYYPKILSIYFEREGMGGKKRGRETLMCGCLSCTLNWGPGPQPRYVP